MSTTIQKAVIDIEKYVIAKFYKDVKSLDN